jgi:hypothetical protein
VRVRFITVIQARVYIVSLLFHIRYKDSLSYTYYKFKYTINIDQTILIYHLFYFKLLCISASMLNTDLYNILYLKIFIYNDLFTFMQCNKVNNDNNKQ